MASFNSTFLAIPRPFITHFSTNVENLWKSTWKTLCISIVKLRAKLPHSAFSCANLHFFTAFSHFSHQLSHHFPSLETTILFHFSTNPTNTTTNNFIERSF